MHKSLLVFLALLGICAAASAQDAAPKSAPEKPAFVPTPAPAATAEPKSPGIMQRLFGSREKGPRVIIQPMPPPKTAAAAPEPPTPKPRARTAPKPKAVKKSSDAENNPATATARAKKTKPKTNPADPEPAEAKAETVKPAPEKPEPPAVEAAAPIKKPRKGKGTPATAAKDGVEPPPYADPEAKEKFRFDQAKAKASTDPEVQELKAKADGAVSDEDTRSAQRAYNKALFSKMRKIDGTLDERINSMEAAILKRLDGK